MNLETGKHKEGLRALRPAQRAMLAELQGQTARGSYSVLLVKSARLLVKRDLLGRAFINYLPRVIARVERNRHTQIRSA